MKNILQLHHVYKQGIKLENNVRRQEQRFQLEMLMMSKCLVEMHSTWMQNEWRKKRHTFQCFRFILSLKMHAAHNRPYIFFFFSFFYKSAWMFMCVCVDFYTAFASFLFLFNVSLLSLMVENLLNSLKNRRKIEK